MPDRGEERTASIIKTAKSRQLPLPSFNVSIGSCVPISYRET